MPPVFKPPGYFTRAPSKWGVVSFLELELSRTGDDYDHEKAIGSWILVLRHLENDSDQERSSYAKKKLEKYYNVSFNPLLRLAAREFARQRWHHQATDNFRVV